MATAFRKDADTTTFMQFFEDSVVHARLIDLRRNTKLASLKPIHDPLLYMPIQNIPLLVIHILTRELPQRNIAFERFLDPDLLRTQDLPNLCIRALVLHTRQNQQPTDLEIRMIEFRAHTSH